MADITPESWAHDLLTTMGYPVTSNNMTSVLAWEYQEGGHFANGATFNPLNTTLGHATYGSMNSAGVSTYPDYQTGMAETVKTLNLPYYDKIRSDLQASADPATTTSDIKSSPWGTWHGGASTAGALGRAKADVAAHPVTAVPPSAAPTAAPAAQPSAPAAVPAATTPAPASASATGYLGADVDGLDKLSQEFTQAAQVVDEVKAACEVIVAAASMFGPFGAAFVAYLKGTVIPWLTAISQALQAMSKVLAAHSQAQKDASSNATSLPSYQSPTTPVTSTQDYPLIGAVAGALLAGGVLAVGLGATTALPALIGAVGGANAAAGSTTAAATTGGVTTPGAEKTGEKAEDPERTAPHTAEVGKNVGTVMNRDALGEFETDELGLPKGSSIHPTATIAQTDGDIAAYKDKGEYVDTEILQLKGSAALYGGIDPTDGGQFGGALSGSANIADVKVHTDVPLGGSSTLKLSDETTLGATASGQAVVGYNPITQTASANVGGEAFVGLRTTATVQEVTPYFTNTTELTGQLGASAAADAGVTLGGGHLDIHGGLGAAVGLGGKVADNLDINYQAIATDAYTGATAVYNEVGTELNGAGQVIESYIAPGTPR